MYFNETSVSPSHFSQMAKLYFVDKVFTIEVWKLGYKTKSVFHVPAFPVYARNGMLIQYQFLKSVVNSGCHELGNGYRKIYGEIC